ncbi:hypothetical protein BH23PAT1_BH23PAT1_4520 [soil metagenome]
MMENLQYAHNGQRTGNYTASPSRSNDCNECVLPMALQESLVNNSDGSSTLKCVKCPFCKRIVDARMTKTSISCPECKAEVLYN